MSETDCQPRKMPTRDWKWWQFSSALQWLMQQDSDQLPTANDCHIIKGPALVSCKSIANNGLDASCTFDAAGVLLQMCWMSAAVV